MTIQEIEQQIIEEFAISTNGSTSMPTSSTWARNAR